MKAIYLTHLVWLIPAALLGLLIQQASVYYGITKTYEQGEVHTANITDFRIKQIAAQTNGYVDLQFIDSDGNNVQERLSLHAQHASRLIGSNSVDIRYRPGTTYDIVMINTFEYHRKTVLINIAVIVFSILVMISISIFGSRYAIRKQKKLKDRGGDDSLQLEYLNSPKAKA